MGCDREVVHGFVWGPNYKNYGEQQFFSSKELSGRTAGPDFLAPNFWTLLSLLIATSKAAVSNSVPFNFISGP